MQRVFKQYHEDTGLKLHWGNWGHWNYEGHKVVADTLTHKLESIIYSEKASEPLNLDKTLKPKKILEAGFDGKYKSAF